MSEDFLFDPWSKGDAEAPATEPVKTARWRTRPAPSEQRRGAVQRRPAVRRPAVSRARLHVASADDDVRVPAGAGAAVHRVRTLAVPLIEAVEARLRRSGHRTLLDDRLEAHDPCLRFRLIPRSAPFDDRPAVAGSVLEVAVRGSFLTASIWLDPLADEPTRETAIETAEVGEQWLKALLMDFIGRSLRQV